jgi:hypothetical protein
MQALVNLPTTKTGPAGTWTIAAGTTTDGKTYSGTVQIHPMGQIYIMSWLTTIGDYSGLAFFEEGHLFAGCSFDDSYGVTLYKINPDGILNGKWTVPSYKGAFALENAVNRIPHQIEGVYDIGGTAPSNGIHKGTLNIRQSGNTYQLTWSMGSEAQYQGIGLRAGDWLVACWGGNNLFSLAYEIQGNRAQGRWARSDQSTLGEEILEKIC